MLWAALLPEAHPSPNPSRTEALQGLAVWCLQFTPRVAMVEAAVLMEVEGSERLFGGRRALAARVREESAALGLAFLAWAPTSLGALALARCGVRNGFAQPLAVLLDALPLASLAAVAAHAPMLARLGCTTLGQVRALPRGALSYCGPARWIESKELDHVARLRTDRQRPDERQQRLSRQ